MDFLDRFGRYCFGANWRTSFCAIVSAVAAFISLHPEFVSNKLVIALANFAFVGGLAAFGIQARDTVVGSNENARDQLDPK